MCLPFYQKACCGGSFTCCSESCNFRKCYGKDNQLEFNKSKNTCSVCGNPGEFIITVTVTRSTEDNCLREDELCLDNIYNIAVSTLEKDELYYAKRKAHTTQSYPHKRA